MKLPSGRPQIVKIEDKKFLRIAIKTHVLTDKDDMLEVIKRYTKGILKRGDIICVSESPLAITQGRAIPEDKIKVSFPARILWRFVRKVPYGVGLRSPQSMQVAINEAGLLRILIASIFSALTKPFGIRGVFYKVAGKQVAMIDAAHTTPVKPYDKCVIKGPKEPEKFVYRVKKELGNPCAVVDVNDIAGAWIVAHTKDINSNLLKKILDDNPMGQGKELTPICLVRRLD